MLILQRRTGESLVIGEDVRISVVSIEGGRVRLAISAPPEVSILRSELLDARLANQDSAVEESAPAELLGLLGGMPSWAPTAASMAAHLESTGKVISYTGVDASKLLPGDLIFYSNGRNGRYRNIYHVSMYYGDGYRLEKPLRAYNRWGNIAMIARPLK